MAVTNQQVLDFLLATPGMSDAQIFAAMRTFGVPPSQMAAVSGVPVNDIIARLAPLIPPNEAILLGDTWIQAQYRTTGSGETQEIGPLESINVYKTTGGVNDKVAVGTDVQNYSPTGQLLGTSKTKKDLSFVGGIVEALKDPVVLAALGGAAAGGLLGGAATGAAGMTAAELAQLDLALGGAGGTAGATSLSSALTTGANVGTLTNLTGGSGLLTGEAAGITAQSVADKLAADAAAQASAQAAKAAADAKAIADAAATADAATKAAANAASAKATADAAAAKAAADAAAAKVTTTAATVAATTGATNLANTAATAATTLTATELANAAKLGLTAAQYAQLFSTGATTAAGLLQQQTSKEAADKARAMIDVETAAAKQAAAFRPVGMTTRFGTSKFGVDPLTGQMTAGYTLSPEAKNAQDRFLTLAGQGLTQAEGAQAQFAPLQTGAQSLFGLGNEYLAQNPQDVAQNYLNQQMALLQPGRELELANLQNKLQQQGRGGLSVAQGGALGATTPELQALYNARAQQEAQLAANAQQYGQQQVAFGAGLLGTGAQTMGQYYAGQQAAYAPYTTAFGQMQALEAAGQQPLTLGANLGQTAAQAGFNVGQLGLRGAGASVELATGKAATTNPYSTAISGLAANPAFGQYVGGLLSPTSPVTAMSAPATTFGSGTYYGNQDLGLFL
jgi:hypothetical protein